MPKIRISHLVSGISSIRFEKTKPIYRPMAGNPKSEVRNPKRKDDYVKQSQFVVSRAQKPLSSILSYAVLSAGRMPSPRKFRVFRVLWWLGRGR